MNIKFERNTLLAALSRLPGKGDVHLSAADESLCLKTGGDNASYQIYAPAKSTGQGGETMVKRDALAKALKALAREPAELRNPGLALAISQGRTTMVIGGIDPQNYPTMPKMPPAEGQLVSLPKQALMQAIGAVSVAMSADLSRLSICGAHITLRPGVLVAEATDGHRLHRKTVAAEHDAYAEATLHRDGVAALKRFLVGPDPECRFAFGGEFVAVSCDGGTMWVRAIDEKFPDVDKVIPAPSERVLTFDRREMIAALRGVSLFSCSRENTIRLNIKPGSVEIRSDNSIAAGCVVTEIDADWQGEPTACAYNPRYMLDALRLLSGDVVRLDIPDRFTPSVFREDGAALLIMPRRL